MFKLGGRSAGWGLFYYYVLSLTYVCYIFWGGHLLNITQWYFLKSLALTSVVRPGLYFLDKDRTSQSMGSVRGQENTEVRGQGLRAG